MNKIRFGFFIVVLNAGRAGRQRPHAQTSIQRLTFSLFAEYQTNVYSTNTAGLGGPLTNTHSLISNILIGTHSVLKAMAIDLEGTNWTNWTDASLVREVNLTNGNEGIFLRTATTETNVSSFFGGSFSNNFTSGVTNAFPGVTNNFTPQLELVRGLLTMTSPTNFATNYAKTAGLYFISLNTTNMKFNLVAVGDGTVTNVQGNVDGVHYEREINAQSLGTAGAFYLNVATNLFNMGSNPPVFFSGPMRGTFTLGQPQFSPIPGPDQSAAARTGKRKRLAMKTSVPILEAAILNVRPSAVREFESAFREASPIIAAPCPTTFPRVAPLP